MANALFIYIQAVSEKPQLCFIIVQTSGTRRELSNGASMSLGPPPPPGKMHAKEAGRMGTQCLGLCLVQNQQGAAALMLVGKAEIRVPRW